MTSLRYALALLILTIAAMLARLIAGDAFERRNS